MGPGKRQGLSLFILVLFLWVLVVGTAGCVKKEEPRGEAGFASITDDLGRTVTLRQEPKRLVSLAPSHTETLFALGLGDRVVGVTDFCDYPEAALSKEKVGGFANPNLEKIISLKPDLVIGNDMNQSVAEELSRVGIAVIILSPHDVSTALKSIATVGRATGASGAAESLLSDIRREIAEVTEKTERLPREQRPLVYYEVWYEPLMTAGPDTVIDNLITLAGGANMASDAGKKYPEYSVEVLLKKNPQVMIHSYAHGSGKTADPETIAARKGWKDISCVQNKRIYMVDANLVTRPGPRIGKALQEFARAIHPEIFGG